MGSSGSQPAKLSKVEEKSDLDYHEMKADLKELAEFFLGKKTNPSKIENIIKTYLTSETSTQPNEKVMGTDDGRASTKSYPIGPDGKRLKPCCACPDTKRARDACVIEKGEENCTELIEAHKACMRNLGFNI